MNPATTTLLSVSWIAALLAAGGAWLRVRKLGRELRSDTLTGMGNRRAFEELDISGPAALAVVDIDRFKDINDSFGHIVGDETLQAVAATMMEVAGAAANPGTRVEVFRFGGDEFAIAFRGRDSVAAADVLEQLRARIEELDLSHKRRIKISAGIADSGAEHPDWRSLLSHADRALYQSKQGGRDLVTIYSDDLQAPRAEDPLALLRVIATAVVGAVDARDSYTHAHSHNVADLAGYIARTMGLPEPEINEIALAGLLHDIGKIGVSDSVLKKPGPLNSEEWIEMQTHCEIGYRILNSITGAERIREMVYSHHERPDGRGYPRGLSGTEIDLGARIICVADAFDSMTANRVYRSAMSPQDALREIAKERGKQFDPIVVDAICELMLYEPDADEELQDAAVVELPPRASDSTDEDGSHAAAA